MRIPHQERFSLRCAISHRPVFNTKKPVFYLCPNCSSLLIEMSKTLVDTDEDLTISCCGQRLAPLIARKGINEPENNTSDHAFTYRIFGGFEHNAIQIKIGNGLHPMREDHCIEWVYLWTFQGGQLKYLPKNTRSIVQFAFADDDSYGYCDREICKMGHDFCQFSCKRGFEVFAYCTKHGLFSLLLGD